MGQRAHAELRRFVAGRALHAEYARLESIGSARVNSALTEHTTNVADFYTTFPTILVNAVVVSGCLAYMAYLSWQVFLVAIVVIGLGSLGYHLAHLRAIRHLDRASTEQDHMFGHFRSLLEGAKELRLNAAKRATFSGEMLDASIDTVRRERTTGMSIFVMSAAWGNFLVYAFIGLVLFVLVGDAPNSTKVMTGFALVFVYLVSPLETLLLTLPRANLARVSADRIDAMARELEATAAAALPSAIPATFESLVLRGVSHRYYREDADDVFTLGPIDLAFTRGQITYLVGGNGSGKTTLAKLLVGLYRPEHGTIQLNGALIDDTNRDQYRQVFSTVFADFHLFERLLTAPSADLDDAGNQLLDKLHLKHKVQVRDGAFSTLALSQGQRKRLALVAAYLENRPFLVFDEWAADQDPAFKDVFYRELLPELRARGKTVLVISHDDRYFHLGDRVIRMEHGRLLGDAGAALDSTPPLRAASPTPEPLAVP